MPLKFIFILVFIYFTSVCFETDVVTGFVSWSHANVAYCPPPRNFPSPLSTALKVCDETWPTAGSIYLRLHKLSLFSTETIPSSSHGWFLKLLARSFWVRNLDIWCIHLRKVQRHLKSKIKFVKILIAQEFD